MCIDLSDYVLAGASVGSYDILEVMAYIEKLTAHRKAPISKLCEAYVWLQVNKCAIIDGDVYTEQDYRVYVNSVVVALHTRTSSTALLAKRGDIALL
jgi:hypothetical protein